MCYHIFFSSYVIDLHSTLESMIEAWHVGHDLPLIRFIGPQKICKLFKVNNLFQIDTKFLLKHNELNLAK